MRLRVSRLFVSDEPDVEELASDRVCSPVTRFPVPVECSSDEPVLDVTTVRTWFVSVAPPWPEERDSPVAEKSPVMLLPVSVERPDEVEDWWPVTRSVWLSRAWSSSEPPA